MADLTTLDNYKKYKDISSTEQDRQINTVIPLVSTLIKTYCNRTFVDKYDTDVVEKFDGFNNSSVFISEFPIKAITSVEYSTDGGATTTALTVNEDYFINEEIGEITTGRGTPFIIGSTLNCIPYNSLIVTYTGGYSNVPTDLEMVTMDLIHYYMTDAYNPNKRLQSASLDTVSFSKLGDTAFPPHIKRVLDLYRSFRV